jgi:hypothetical protein
MAYTGPCPLVCICSSNRSPFEDEQEGCYGARVIRAVGRPSGRLAYRSVPSFPSGARPIRQEIPSRHGAATRRP